MDEREKARLETSNILRTGKREMRIEYEDRQFVVYLNNKRGSFAQMYSRMTGRERNYFANYFILNHRYFYEKYSKPKADTDAQAFAKAN